MLKRILEDARLEDEDEYIFNFSRGPNDRIFIFVRLESEEMVFKSDKYEYTRIFWQRFPEADRNDDDELVLRITDKMQITQAIELMINRAKREYVPRPKRPDFMSITREELEGKEYFYNFKSEELDVVLDIFYDAKHADVDFMTFNFAYPCEITFFYHWSDEDEHAEESPANLYLDNDQVKIFDEIPKAFPDMIPGYEGNLPKLNWFPRNPYRIFDLLHYLAFDLHLTYLYNDKNRMLVEPKSNYGTLTSVQRTQLGMAGLLYLQKDVVSIIATITPRLLLSMARTNRQLAELARNDRVWEYMFRRDFSYRCEVYGGTIPLSFKAREIWSPEQLHAFRKELGMLGAEKWDEIDGPMPWKRWYSHAIAARSLQKPDPVTLQSQTLEIIMGEFFEPHPIPSNYQNRAVFEAFVESEAMRLPWTCGKAFRTTEIINREPIVRVIMSYYDHMMKFTGPTYPSDYDASRVQLSFPPKDVFIPSISDYVTRMMDNYDYRIPKDAMLPLATWMWFMHPSEENIKRRTKNVRKFLVNYIKLMVIATICRRDFSDEKTNPLIMEQIK